MRLAPDHQMIQTLAPDRSDQSFQQSHSARARLVAVGAVPQMPHGAQPARDDKAINSISISDA